jgi:hypothetical protein
MRALAIAVPDAALGLIAVISVIAVAGSSANN